MEDKKLLFPLLLFGIFFVLIAITGFFQIAITKRNVEGLLLDQAETLFQSVAREIEMNMEYLILIEKSPSIITPNFLNVMAYDEAIVDDLYGQFSKATGPEQAGSSLKNVFIADKDGKELVRKGSIKVDKTRLNLLLRKDRQTVIRMPSDKDRSLFMGIKLPDRLLFFELSPEELENFRKMYIMKTIVENEEKRLNIADITIYDDSGRIYLGTDKRSKECFQDAEAPGFPLFPQLLHGDIRIQQARERHHQEDEREFHHAAAFPRPRRGRRNLPDIPARKESTQSS